jgi:hypothetical protein
MKVRKKKRKAKRKSRRAKKKEQEGEKEEEKPALLQLKRSVLKREDDDDDDSLRLPAGSVAFIEVSSQSKKREANKDTDDISDMDVLNLAEMKSHITKKSKDDDEEEDDDDGDEDDSFIALKSSVRNVKDEPAVRRGESLSALANKPARTSNNKFMELKTQIAAAKSRKDQVSDLMRQSAGLLSQLYPLVQGVTAGK